MILRPYQEQAVEAVYRHLRERDDNPVCVIPTAGGKTPILAAIARDAIGRWNGRVLILAHVKELLEQAVDKLHQVAPELWNRTGVYSAGLKSRDTEHPILIASIQSLYKRAHELDAFDLVIVDECHLIGESETGMYRSFLADARVANPHLRVIGLTATPFRMKSGPICSPEGFLNHVCFEAGIKELIAGGYLCPLVTKAGREKPDTSGLHVRAGEFVAAETEALMNTVGLVESACREIVERTQERRSCLVFASGIAHAEHIAGALAGRAGIPVATVFGETPAEDRARVIEDFREGRLKYVVNVNVLTTGFDAPNVDCVALLRPTMSPGLYYQMVGRGFRICPDKSDCLVLDFGGNALRHGPVDAVQVRGANGTGEPRGGEAPAKECPDCQSVIALASQTCPDCGHEFPDRRQATHAAEASDADILSGRVAVTEHEVLDVSYHVHTKRDAPEDAPRTLRVDYRIGLGQWQSEWICIEHDGYARQKAQMWWRKRSASPVPETVEDAVELAEDGALCETRSITIRRVSGEKYDRIVGYELGEKPGWTDDAADTSQTADLHTADGVPW